MPENIRESMSRRVTPYVRVMVIGSMPGEESLRRQQYYAHPRNNFWKYMAQIFADISTDDDYETRVDKLLGHGIGLWDVMKRCSRKGSLDSNIQDVEVNDFAVLSKEAPDLQKLLFNGGKAFETFYRSANYEWARVHNINCVKMPSTSPANAGQHDKDKLARWQAELNEMI